MSTDPVRVMVIGAHPDDADLQAGGIAARYAADGHRVRFVSMTDGSAGDHELGRAALAERQGREAAAAADVIGIEYDVLDNRDGALQPPLANRRDLIRLIRGFAPGLLSTHRPYDYHLDHLATGRLVRDATYMVRVRNVCPDGRAIDSDPIVGHLPDRFEKSVSFEADIAVEIDEVIDRTLAMLDAHPSQIYEWLPHVENRSEDVPADAAAHREWLRDWRLGQDRAIADRYRETWIDRYG